MTGALSNLTYRKLLLAQILSLVGSGLTTIALGILAYELASEKAGQVLGFAFAIKMVAYVGLAPIASAIAERLPRKPYLVFLDIMRASLVLLLPFVTQVWQIYVLIFAFQAFSAAFTPAFQATIPNILEDEAEYTQALSYSRLAYDLESLVSPILVGLLLSQLAFHWLFAGTAVGFLASAVLVSMTALPVLSKVKGQAPFINRVTRGSMIYLGTPRLRGMLFLYPGVAVATAIILVNTVVYVKGILGLGDNMVVLFFAASGIGSMIVALVLPLILERINPRSVMVAGCCLLLISLIGKTLAQGFSSGLGVWFLLGAGTSMIQTPSGLLLTRSCDKDDRPAVFAAHFALTHACWLFAYPLTGVIGAQLGFSTGLFCFSSYNHSYWACCMAVKKYGRPVILMQLCKGAILATLSSYALYAALAVIT